MQTWKTAVIGGIAAAAAFPSAVHADPAPLSFDRVPVGLDSGPVRITGAGVAFSDVVSSPGADWIRLYFGQTDIPAGAALVVTSARTGEHQILTAQTLAQWSGSSAYFAGDTVYVDLVVDAPMGVDGRVVVDAMDAGLPPLADRTICGNVDDRVLSNDARAARLAPQGCTAWLFNNRPNSAITANHCGAAGGDVLWFNVPLRTAFGSAVPPSPEDQYPVDGSSVQSAGAWSLGNDWQVFGVFNNANTGLSPVDAQKDSYVLARNVPVPDGQPITITGYGTTGSPVPQAWYAVQKTHTGGYTERSGTIIRYTADTTGGNSGSAVFDESSQRAIGIHTNGGCTTSPFSANAGTSLGNTGLRSALMQARGVAAGPRPGVIRLTTPAPTRIEPEGGTEVVIETTADADSPLPQPVGLLHVFWDDPAVPGPAVWTAYEMNWRGNGERGTSFPAMPCGSSIRYYLSGVGEDGTAYTFPPAGPDAPFEARVSREWTVIGAEGFTQAGGGWAVSSETGTAGGWEWGAPPAFDTRGGPNTDANGDGLCWTTGLAANVDLDGGPTRLTSPAFDLGGTTDPRVEAMVWMNADGSSDVLEMDVSADGGATWTLALTRTSTPGWTPVSVRLADFVSLTDQVRVRFRVADAGSGQTIEAGVDAFAIRDVACQPPSCGLADLAPPIGALDLGDVTAFVGAFLDGGSAADIAAPFGLLDLADVTAFSDSFASGCP